MSLCLCFEPSANVGQLPIFFRAFVCLGHGQIQSCLWLEPRSPLRHASRMGTRSCVCVLCAVCVCVCVFFLKWSCGVTGKSFLLDVRDQFFQPACKRLRQHRSGSSVGVQAIRMPSSCRHVIPAVRICPEAIKTLSDCIAGDCSAKKGSCCDVHGRKINAGCLQAVSGDPVRKELQGLLEGSLCLQDAHLPEQLHTLFYRSTRLQMHTFTPVCACSRHVVLWHVCRLNRSWWQLTTEPSRSEV